jgi:hypothetical protein
MVHRHIKWYHKSVNSSSSPAHYHVALYGQQIEQWAFEWFRNTATDAMIKLRLRLDFPPHYRI